MVGLRGGLRQRNAACFAEETTINGVISCKASKFTWQAAFYAAHHNYILKYENVFFDSFRCVIMLFC